MILNILYQWHIKHSYASMLSLLIISTSNIFSAYIIGNYSYVFHNNEILLIYFGNNYSEPMYNITRKSKKQCAIYKKRWEVSDEPQRN